MENLNNSNSDFITEGKSTAVIAYLTLIGLIIAFIQNNEKKNPFAAFHIRQCIGLFLTGFALGFISLIPILGWIVGILGMILMIILWFIGFVSALNGKMKPLPIVGNLYQKWFASI